MPTFTFRENVSIMAEIRGVSQYNPPWHGDPLYRGECAQRGPCFQRRQLRDVYTKQTQGQWPGMLLLWVAHDMTPGPPEAASPTPGGLRLEISRALHKEGGLGPGAGTFLKPNTEHSSVGIPHLLCVIRTLAHVILNSHLRDNSVLRSSKMGTVDNLKWENPCLRLSCQDTMILNVQKDDPGTCQSLTLVSVLLGMKNILFLSSRG